MSRYIDADKILNWNKYKLSDAVKYGNKNAEQRGWSYSTLMMYEIADEIGEQPTADVRENTKGKWVFKEVMIRSPLAENYYCSICKTNTARCWNFCPNCGADMREVKE